MRLLHRDAQGLAFELHPRERELVVFLLQRYPVLDPSYHQIATPEDRDAFTAEQQLLTECVTADQQANRQRIQEFIRTRLTPPPLEPHQPAPKALPPTSDASASPEPGRSQPARETRLPLTYEEADWLLRMFNEVRVGAWVRLGRPGEGEMHTPELAARGAADYATMELGGLLQSILLRALDDG
jgi:hypothetical protein